MHACRQKRVAAASELAFQTSKGTVPLEQTCPRKVCSGSQRRCGCGTGWDCRDHPRQRAASLHTPRGRMPNGGICVATDGKRCSVFYVNVHGLWGCWGEAGGGGRGADEQANPQDPTLKSIQHTTASWNNSRTSKERSRHWNQQWHDPGPPQHTCTNTLMRNIPNVHQRSMHE